MSSPERPFARAWETLGALPGRTKLLLAALVLLMTALPAVVSLMRDDSYTSRIPIGVEATQESAGGPSQEERRVYLERLIPFPRVSTATAFQVSFPLDRQTVVDDSRVVSTGSRGVELVVESGTPDRAREMANREARLIVDLGARRRTLQARSQPRLARLVQRSTNEKLPLAERHVAQRRLFTLLERLGKVAPTLVLRERASEPSVTRGADKLVDRVTGSFPGDPGPLPAVAAGLALALGLLAVWFLAEPLRGPAGPRSPPGGTAGSDP